MHLKLPHHQTGITLIGMLFVVLPIALVVYAGIRLTPVYLNYLSVSSTLNALPSAFQEQAEVGASEIRDRIERHFEIDSVNYPTVKDIDITRAEGGWQVEAAYYDTAPLFDGISVQVGFDKVVLVKDPALGNDGDEE